MPDRVRSGRHVRLASDEAPIDTAPIRGGLRTWAPITVAVASHSPAEPLWDQLVRRYH